MINGQNADYVWSWGNNFEYRVKALKESGLWKISYLQGFDFHKFMPTKQE